MRNYYNTCFKTDFQPILVDFWCGYLGGGGGESYYILKSGGGRGPVAPLAPLVPPPMYIKDTAN